VSAAVVKTAAVGEIRREGESWTGSSPRPPWMLFESFERTRGWRQSRRR